MVDKYDIRRKDRETARNIGSACTGQAGGGCVLHTQIEGGDILPNVKNVVNPSMLMESRQLEQMLDKMSDMYRYVFIDAPPLSLVSDGEKIGSLCDGAILVVRGGLPRRSWYAIRSSSWREPAVRFLDWYIIRVG